MSYRLTEAGHRLYHSGALPDPTLAPLCIMGWFRVRVDGDWFATYWRTSTGDSTINTVTTNDTGLGTNVFTAAGSITGTYMNAVDEWVHIATVDDNGFVTHYVTPGGGAIISQSGSILTGAPDQICIGGRLNTDATESLIGNAAYVRVFAGLLSQAQVEAERDSAAGILAPWASWPLTTATDLSDTSGNGRHLVAVAPGALTEDGPPIQLGPPTRTRGFLGAPL